MPYIESETKARIREISNSAEVVIDSITEEVSHIELKKEHFFWLIKQAHKLEDFQQELAKIQALLKISESGTEDDNKTKSRYATEIGELISLNLWSARRLNKIHKDFAYDELEKITSVEYERL